MRKPNEVPSDDQVVAALEALQQPATALQLCRALMAEHGERRAQLAIQRAAERGRILVNADWSLTVAHELVAA